MQVTVKLYATLAQHLPPGAQNNQAILDLPDDATAGSVIDRLNLTGKNCHLVLVNGAYVAPSERSVKGLRAGDVVAMWPPVAGG